MERFSGVFIHHEVHEFAFSGEFILFAHDFEEGDGVLEVEIAEVEALGQQIIAALRP